MNYIQSLAAEIKAAVPAGKLPEDGNVTLLFLDYAALALVKGESVTTEDVHNVWAAWMTGDQPDHDSIQPFSELDTATQKEDSPFVFAIRVVARAHGL